MHLSIMQLIDMQYGMHTEDFVYIKFYEFLKLQSSVWGVWQRGFETAMESAVNQSRSGLSGSHVVRPYKPVVANYGILRNMIQYLYESLTLYILVYNSSDHATWMHTEPDNFRYINSMSFWKCKAQFICDLICAWRCNDVRQRRRTPRWVDRERLRRCGAAI